MTRAERKCRREGHVLDPDPGDFVLRCTRCHVMVDLHDVVRALGSVTK